MRRFPKLAPRKAQNPSKTRNAVVDSDIMDLFHALAKNIIEKRLSASQIFNMDETAFMTRSKSKGVIAVRGSANVWDPEATASFHLSILACASAAGLVVPPLFILPGQRVNADMLDECHIEGASVTTTSSGFINSETFVEWLSFYASAVHAEVQRPLVLILDGCLSNYSLEIHDAARRVDVLLVFLPSNATHLLQPLDIEVFASMKRKLRRLLDVFADDSDDGYCSIGKAQAVKLAAQAWKCCRFKENIVSGFMACGIFPLSLVKMQKRLNLYKNNGIPAETARAAWPYKKDAIQQHGDLSVIRGEALAWGYHHRMCGERAGVRARLADRRVGQCIC